MSFVGNPLYSCHIDFFRHKQVYLIVVDGIPGNFCGHALLNFGGHGGFYVHVDGKRDPPKYMTQLEYERYSRENHKTELLRKQIHVPNIDGCLLELENIMTGIWRFGVVVHNCATFVEQVINAGGGSHFNIMANCPSSVLHAVWSID